MTKTIIPDDIDIPLDDKCIVTTTMREDVSRKVVVNPPLHRPPVTVNPGTDHSIPFVESIISW